MFKIAIDGPAGAGKSTISKEIAKKLNIEYLDTGAMYRAVTLKAMRLNVDMEKDESYDFLKDTLIEVKDGKIFLDGEDVSTAIRSVDITNNVSTPSKIGVVRSYLVDLQRKLSESINVVMDGRDIGTVVLPNAELKVYLDASVECRALRRKLERDLAGVVLSLEETIEEIKVRDHKDSTRKINPLRKADDAVLIDSSDMSIDEVVNTIIKLAYERGFNKMSEKFTNGQNVQGYIIHVTPSYLKIELGEDALGIIYANDILDVLEGHSLHEYYNVGEQFEAQVKVLSKDQKTGQPLYILSTKLEQERLAKEAKAAAAKAKKEAKIVKFQALKDADEIFSAKVSKVLKTGAFLSYEGEEVFLPVKQSEVSLDALAKLQGEELEVLVTFIDVEKTQVQVSQTLASRKKARLAKKAEFEALEVGQLVDGTVTTMLPFGAIVSFGSQTGLLHQSELDHKIVRDVKQYLHEGQELKAKIIKIEDGKISLSVRALTPHPWDVLCEKYHVGDVFEGTVEKVIPAGLLIKLTEEYSGLMPRSEYSWLLTDKMDEQVSEGATITVKVLDIDNKKKRVSLSRRATLENTWADIKLHRDEIVTVTIAAVEEKGAKVTYKNVTGFLPVSEVSATRRVGRVDEIYPVGTEVEALVLNCDPLRAKLLVSIKAIEQNKERESFDKYMKQQDSETPVSTMGDLFAGLNLFEEEAPKAAKKATKKTK